MVSKRPWPDSGGMSTLHIEHAISDYPTWRSAFDRFESARENAGVLGHRIRRPVDDDRYVVIDLDFEDASAAKTFLAFLRQNVWAVPGNSPALIGSPDALILMDEGS
jgi:hypothetical protein